MLIQVPRGPSKHEGSDRAETRDAFESALRRDLASAPVVSYDTVLGGLGKRSIDVAVLVLTLPFWLSLLGISALVSKIRFGKAFDADERIGYGGQHFRRFKLRVLPAQTGEAANANVETDAWRVIEGQANDSGAKWRYAFERLPQIFNVLRGDMALVGPTPLSHERFEALKAGKRHYVSARPGVIGVTGMLEPGDEPTLQYKAYAMSWSFTTDALIFWEALRALRKRGELWQPGLIGRAKPAAQPEVLHRRRRGG